MLAEANLVVLYFVILGQIEFERAGQRIVRAADQVEEDSSVVAALSKWSSRSKRSWATGPRTLWPQGLGFLYNLNSLLSVSSL